MAISLKTIVKDNTVFFSHYRASHLYYTVVVENQKYIFPVPIEDIGDATFLNQDKAMILMRYIRKAIENGSFVKTN